MFLDGRTVTLSNVPNWRSQLGYAPESDLVALQAQVEAQSVLINNLTALIADLTTRMGALEALAIGERLDALEAAPAGSGGGTNSPMILGDDSNLYRLKLRDVDGEAVLDQESATFGFDDNPAILGDNGTLYRLRLRVVDGELVLDQEVAV